MEKIEDTKQQDNLIITQNNSQELLPSIAINMEHKIILSDRQKELLLQDRQSIIKESLLSIQNNFLKIGKALGEIRKFKLYKADPLYNTWASFIKNRLTNKLHQSTITDYIAIVKMQAENKDFMTEEDIIKIGYKKAKLIKSKLALTAKENNPNTKEKLEEIIKTFYLQSFKELKDIPYTTYTKALEDRLKPIKKIERKDNYIIKEENAIYTIRLDKKRKKITFTLNKNHNNNKIEQIFSIISSTLNNNISNENR